MDKQVIVLLDEKKKKELQKILIDKEISLTKLLVNYIDKFLEENKKEK